MMPKDTNGMGTIFGGVILPHIDHAGAVEALCAVKGRLVTVEAERQHSERQTVRVTEAEVVYVRVDEHRRPLPLDAEA